MPLEVDSLTSEESRRFLGTHQEVLDGETAFARQMQLRQAAKEAFIDASQRLRASMLRKTTPTRGLFLAGDLAFLPKGQIQTWTMVWPSSSSWPRRQIHTLDHSWRCSYDSWN